MPDALSKTIPIWCAVINRAVAKRRGGDERWDQALYVPPNVVSGTEKSQIEARIDGWAEALLVSSEVGARVKADRGTGIKFDASGTNRTTSSVLYPPGDLLAAFTTDTRRERTAAICADHLCFRVRVYRPWWTGTYAQQEWSGIRVYPGQWR